jgi:superfamily II DNA/RNA helicase
VATDIAARGIHVDDVALVVHVDPPTEHKAYLHRSGRTARAGAKGAVVTVILPDQARDVATMIRQAGIRPTSANVVPGDARTLALTGPFADKVFRAPAPSPAPQPVAARPGGGRGRPPRRRRAR